MDTAIRAARVSPSSGWAFSFDMAQKDMSSLNGEGVGFLHSITSDEYGGTSRAQTRPTQVKIAYPQQIHNSPPHNTTANIRKCGHEIKKSQEFYKKTKPRPVGRSIGGCYISAAVPGADWVGFGFLAMLVHALALSWEMRSARTGVELQVGELRANICAGVLAVGARVFGDACPE